MNSNLFSFIRRIPKRLSALVIMIAAAIVIPAALFAWGPSRPTFTINKPADHVTFNSITNNPNIGDERNFVGIRENGSNDTWSDSVTVQPNKEYVVRMYVHNNAAENLKLVAHNVTAKFNLPTSTGKSIEVNGFLSSSNASPKEVYDQATFKSNQDFNLAYQAGTLKYYNNATTKGFTIPETVFTNTGAKLGYTKMDGNIPGCFKYAGYLTFIVKPQFAEKSQFTMSKLVSEHGTNKWSQSYAAQPGEKVDYLLQYKNVGKTQQDDVTFRDSLPEGLSYVTGTTVFGNSQHPKGTSASDNLTNGTGINVGSYAAGANAWVIYSATVAANDKLSACGSNTLTNEAKVTTGGGSMSSTADVTVSKDCPKPTTPGVLITKTVDNQKSKQVAVGQEFTYQLVVKNTGDTDLTNVIVTDQTPDGVTLVSADQGAISNNQWSYTIPSLAKGAQVNFSIKAKVTAYKTGSLMNTACVNAPEVNPNKPAEPDSCDTATVTVTPPAEKCPIPGKEDLPKDDTSCSEDVTPPVTPTQPETPSKPEALPQTGMSQGVMAIIGLGSLTASIGYYVASRRAISNRY